jgi:hypothetical protein
MRVTHTFEISAGGFISEVTPPFPMDTRRYVHIFIWKDARNLWQTSCIYITAFCIFIYHRPTWACLCRYWCCLFFFPVALQSLKDLGRLTYKWFLELFRHMVGLLGGVISPSQGLYLRRTTQHRNTRTNIYALSGVRTHGQPTGQDPRLRPHGHCDRHWCSLSNENTFWELLRDISVKPLKPNEPKSLPRSESYAKRKATSLSEARLNSVYEFKPYLKKKKKNSTLLHHKN